MTQRKPPAKNHEIRVLLALDGVNVSPCLLPAAVSRCVPLTDRLDILLVNSPKAPTSLLSRLLLHLEHAGIDYRLVCGEGDLGEHVSAYLQRFVGISLVLVDNLSSLEHSMGPEIPRLQALGCRFIPIT